MRRKLTITLLTTMMLVGLWQLTTTVSAQQDPLTLAKILTGLQTKGNTPETATLAARNVFITRRVQQVGVTFRLNAEFERELRNAGATAALIAAIRANGPAAPTPTPSNSRPSASFRNVRVDYDVTEGGQKGMRINVSFTTYSMKNVPGYVAIYFQDERGNYLKDKNDKFVSGAGEVAAYREVTPAYDPAVYNDFGVFIPYSELDLSGSGKWNLRMDIKLIYKAGGVISELTKKDFEYSQGDAVADCPNPDSVTAKVNRIWIDYNVTENGQRGMRLHVNFEITGLKGVESKLAARVQNSGGNWLMNSSSAYSNRRGELEVSFEMNPGYATTVYKDADIFLPYNQINIGRGKHNLTIDFDVNCSDGELIKHLDTYEFEFDRP